MPARRRNHVVRTVALGCAAAVVVLPIYITILYSLLPNSRLLHYPPDLLPIHTTLDAWSVAWRRGHFSRYLVNSALVSASITAGQVATSVLAAYAFAFISFPGRRLLFGLFLACTMVPFAGHPVAELPDHRLARLDRLVPGPDRSVPGVRNRNVPPPPGLPDRATELVNAEWLDGYGTPGFWLSVGGPDRAADDGRSRCTVLSRRLVGLPLAARRHRLDQPPHRVDRPTTAQ